MQAIKHIYKALSFKNFSISALIIYIIAFINVSLIAIIIASLFFKVSATDLISIFDLNSLNAIKITFFSVSISLIITLLLGIPTAFVLATNNTAPYKVINIFSILPILLPPSVAGLALLITLGRKGLIGSLFADYDIYLAFTFMAVIIVQVFIMMPIFVQILKNGFKTIDKEIIEAANIAGAGKKDLLFYIYLPLNLKHLFTAIILCVLRASGEFGATIMFAGNIEGKTQTVSTAIYSFAQDNLSAAIALAVILIITFLIPLLLLALLQKS